MLIYLVTNKVNGKLYVGKTKQTMKSRWQQHCYASAVYDDNFPFHIAIREFGKEAFQIEQVYSTECSVELASKELEYTNKYDSVFPKGYNVKIGTKFSPTLAEALSRILTGKKQSKAHKQALSRIKSLPEYVEVARKNLAKSHELQIGVPFSQSRKDNISNALKTNSSFVTQKQTRGYGGMVYALGCEPTMEEETRRKVVRGEALKIARLGLQEKIASGEVRTGGAVTPMFGEKNGMFGKTQSLEAKENLRQKALARYALKRAAKLQQPQLTPTTSITISNNFPIRLVTT